LITCSSDHGTHLLSRAELRFHEPGNGVWASDDYGVVADVEID
jgi:hypothetical protein